MNLGTASEQDQSASQSPPRPCGVPTQSSWLVGEAWHQAGCRRNWVERVSYLEKPWWNHYTTNRFTTVSEEEDNKGAITMDILAKWKASCIEVFIGRIILIGDEHMQHSDESIERVCHPKQCPNWRKWRTTVVRKGFKKVPLDMGSLSLRHVIRVIRAFSCAITIMEIKPEPCPSSLDVITAWHNLKGCGKNGCSCWTVTVIFYQQTIWCPTDKSFSTLPTS